MRNRTAHHGSGSGPELAKTSTSLCRTRRGLPSVYLRLLGQQTRGWRGGRYSDERWREASGRLVGRPHLPVHRYRGFDTAVGGRPRRDAGCARDARRGVARGRCSRMTARSSTTPVTECARCSPRRASAVEAAVDAQRALELPVRMGIATGEAELRGGDYFGTVLNRTARVMAPATAARSCSTARLRVCSAASISFRWGRGGCATSPNPSAFSKSTPRV